MGPDLLQLGRSKESEALTSRLSPDLDGVPLDSGEVDFLEKWAHPIAEVLGAGDVLECLAVRDPGCRHRDADVAVGVLGCLVDLDGEALGALGDVARPVFVG